MSPIIGGKAVKGPTAKMMAELGLPVDAAAVARHYGDLLDHYVIDDADADAVTGFDLPVTATRTLMETLADREALARVVLTAGPRLLTMDLWAVVPVKERDRAKERLAPLLPRRHAPGAGPGDARRRAVGARRRRRVSPG